MSGIYIYVYCVIPYYIIYRTARFTLFAKVKVIIETKVEAAVVCHRSYVLRCKGMTILSFCQEFVG